MSDAAELRESLERLESLADFKGSHSERVAYAARTIALPILEADPELVERLAKRMQEVARRHVPREAALAAARDVLADILAAISTPTPGADSLSSD